MPRPPKLSRANLLFCSLIILSVVGASLFAASRAEASRQTSGDARPSKFAGADAKARLAERVAALRSAKQQSGKAAQLGGRPPALRACNGNVATPITIPTTINSALTADDCQLSDGARYDIYSFEGRAGQQVSALLTSTDVDAYLYVGRFEGDTFVILGEDDNSGGGTNARLPDSGFATLTQTTTYYLFPSAANPANTLGNYTLTVSASSTPCPGTPAVITVGATNGALAAGDCRFANDTFYDAYAFNGTAGQQLSITLTSTGFNALVYLLDADRNILGTNDDGGGGTNARLPATSGFVTLPYNGTYYIVVSATIPPEGDINAPPPTGSYTLTLADGGTCPSTPITIGQPVNGTLAAGDCRRPNETPFDLYSFSGTGGQQVAISMSSSAFDPYLYLAGPNFGLIFEDNNGGGGVNARIPAGNGFVTLPETGTYYILANAVGAGASGAYTLSLTPAPPPAATLQFLGASFAAAEGGHAVTVTVTRTGTTTNEVSVGYATSDGTASERRDYTTAVGRLRFAAGETSKSFEVLITDDRFDDDNESFTVTLSAPSGATLGTQASSTVTITDNDAANGPSPVKDGSIDPEFFVRQHYADFLNRLPDQSGLSFWMGQMTNCGNPDLLVCRINVSAAFFQSIEFQQTGFLVHRAYKAAFGNLPNKPVPLTFREFIAGQRRIGENVQVNVGNWEQQLEANKVAFFNEFVADPRFTTAYPTSLTPAQFVDALNANTGGALSAAERNQLVSDLTAGTKTRAQVLRAVAEDADLVQSEFRRAFVLAEYFGYLRRNPDDVGFDGQADPNFVGYNFWLGKLNDFNGDFVAAEMVKGFITSIEYQSRFGQ